MYMNDKELKIRLDKLTETCGILITVMQTINQETEDIKNRLNKLEGKECKCNESRFILP
jgi:predicted nuclease with TOPRIM domain